MELRAKILRKIIVFVMVAAIAIPFISPEIFAAAKVTAEGPATVSTGETFTVRVTYGGDEQVGRVDGQLTYDTSKLEYISGGTSEGDTGYVQMKLAGTDGTITFTLKFKAIESGNTELQITTNEMYDFAEIPLDTPSLTKNIKIGSDGGGANDDGKKEEVEEIESEASAEDEYAVEYLEDENNNITMILLISAAVLLVLIIIIAVVLRKRR